MRVVQALHWLRDMLSRDHERIARRIDASSSVMTDTGSLKHSDFI
jgi:hypothetical protein